MRYLLFLLVLLPSISFAGGRIFSYRGVSLVENGADNFKLSQYFSEDKAGEISLRSHVLTINERRYNLKPTNKENIFRVKGGMVQFVYENHQLVAVRLSQYNQMILFNIEDREAVASIEREKSVY